MSQLSECLIGRSENNSLLFKIRRFCTTDEVAEMRDVPRGIAHTG